MDINQIVSAVIAGLLVIGIIALLVLQIVVPDQLWSSLLVVIGFYFGQVTGFVRARLK